MPEWSNGADSKSVGLVPTKVRILLPAYAPVAQPGLERFPPKEEVVSSNLTRRTRKLLKLL